MAEAGQGGPPDGGLVRDAQRFLRGFGLIVAVWASLLAVTSPTVERPVVLGIGVGITWVWSLVALPVSARWPWVWGSGWLVVAVGLELLGPASGTDGWSVAGGSSLLVLAAAAITQRRAVLVAVVVALAVAVLGRGLFVDEFTIAGALGTFVLFAFSAVSLWWLVRTVLAGEQERERLRQAVARAEAERALAQERAESAARLHDSVLQSLASIHRAEEVGEARDHASRASSQLRAWIREGRTPVRADGRGEGSGGETLRRALESAVVEAGAGRVGFSASGDVHLDDPGRLLVAAATEAVRNAVTHTTGAVRVYLEVRDGRATAWVSDQGEGFDRESIPADRHGVRDSIVARLERAGGTADLEATSDGSEWCLAVPVS